MMPDSLRVERREDAAAIVVIDRPEKLNALTVAMRRGLRDLILELGADRTVKVIVIRGAGEQAFCAGGDLAEFLTLGPRDLLRWGEELSAPEQVLQPVIAAIDGYCLGAGLELALACDFRLGTTRAALGLPEVRLGMMPGSGGTQRLVRVAGFARAKAMVLRGERVSAADAEAIGLLHQVVAPGALDAAVQTLARELSQYSPVALAAIKQVMNRAPDAPLDAGLEMERKAYAMLRSTHDYEEGVRAFLERRTPVFTGQ